MIALFVIAVVVITVVLCAMAKGQSGPTHLPPPRSSTRPPRVRRPQPPMGYIVQQSNRRRHG
jgi:hypothetical protein